MPKPSTPTNGPRTRALQMRTPGTRRSTTLRTNGFAATFIQTPLREYGHCSSAVWSVAFTRFPASTLSGTWMNSSGGSTTGTIRSSSGTRFGSWLGLHRCVIRNWSGRFRPPISNLFVRSATLNRADMSVWVGEFLHQQIQNMLFSHSHLVVVGSNQINHVIKRLLPSSFRINSKFPNRPAIS